MNCGVGCRCSSDPVLLWLWCRLVAAVLIQPLAQELPHVALKSKKREKTLIIKDTCTPVFIAALFAIAKTWKQPKCTARDDWIKKMWHIDTIEYWSAIKRNKVMPFAAT